MRRSRMFAIFMLSGLSLWCVPVFAGEFSQAEVIHREGGVEVLLSDVGDYAPAEEGMTLEAGDQVRTGAGRLKNTPCQNPLAILQ